MVVRHFYALNNHAKMVVSGCFWLFLVVKAFRIVELVCLLFKDILPTSLEPIHVTSPERYG